MPERATGNFTAGWNVANQLDAIRVGGFGRIEFLIGPFDTVDDGNQGDVTHEARLAVSMNAPHGGTNLVIGVRGDIFHEKVNPAGITLQDMQDLQCAVAYVDFRRFRGLYGFGVAEMRRDVCRQCARKKNRKEAANSG